MERHTSPHGARARRAAFLAAYRETANVRRSCAAAGVDRRQHYRWLQDAAYAAAFDQAKDDAADLLEEEARRRAIQGVQRLKFDKDGNALRDPRTITPDNEAGDYYVEHEYSDALLTTLLKAVRPEVYRERHELSGLGGAPLVPVQRVVIYAPGTAPALPSAAVIDVEATEASAE